MRKNKILKYLAENLDKIIIITEDIIYPYKGFDLRKLYRDNYSYRQSLEILERKHFIKTTSQNKFAVTFRGKLELMKNQQTKKRVGFDFHHWDKKWRIISFDIPEKYRKIRRYLREYLYLLGFKPIQQSLWISPQKIKFYDIEALFDTKIQEKILFFETKSISEVEKIKKLFK